MFSGVRFLPTRPQTQLTGDSSSRKPCISCRFCWLSGLRSWHEWTSNPTQTQGKCKFCYDKFPPLTSIHARRHPDLEFKKWQLQQTRHKWTESMNKSIDLSFDQSINQSINRSIAQSINGSMDQSDDQPISRSIDQSTTRSIDQPTNQPSNQSINQSITI